jgi:hypothetical protein
VIVVSAMGHTTAAGDGHVALHRRTGLDCPALDGPA